MDANHSFTSPLTTNPLFQEISCFITMSKFSPWTGSRILELFLLFTLVCLFESKSINLSEKSNYWNSCLLSKTKSVHIDRVELTWGKHRWSSHCLFWNWMLYVQVEENIRYSLSLMSLASILNQSYYFLFWSHRPNQWRTIKLKDALLHSVFILYIITELLQ